MFLISEWEFGVKGCDHASPQGPTLLVEVQDDRSLFQSLGRRLSPPKSLFLHRTKKNFLVNIQNVITLSEYSTVAVLVELEPAVKEEAMFQLIESDNSRTFPAGFDQLQFRD